MKILNHKEKQALVKRSITMRRIRENDNAILKMGTISPMVADMISHTYRMQQIAKRVKRLKRSRSIVSI